MQPDHTTDVLILGGGIGGYECFRALQKQTTNTRITIVDQNDFFTFVPLLHEVASGGVAPKNASAPLRELMRGSDQSRMQARVESIDPEGKIVTTSEGTIGYQTCIVALGSTTNFFGVEGAAEYTYPIRTLSEAEALRASIRERLEVNPRATVSITIIGGGYTGVEVAAQFAELSHRDLRKRYPSATLTVRIVHSRDTILPALPKKVQQNVTRRLKKMGVELLLNERAATVTKDAVEMKSGATIPNDITIWATGFKSHGDALLPEGYSEKGRIPVNAYLQCPNEPSLYAIGDIALIKDSRKPDAFLPQLGEVAHDGGAYLGKALAQRIAGKEPKPFQFHSKGMLIPIGDWYGAAIFGKRTFFGRIPWIIRQAAYVLFLPGLARKIRTVVDWKLSLFRFRNRLGK